MASFEELARRGEQRRRERVEERDERRDELDAKQLRFAQISTTRLGVLCTYLGGLIVFAVVAVPTAYWLIAPIFRTRVSSGESNLRILAPLGLGVAAIVIVQVIARVRSRTTYARALAWLETVPFDVDGFMQMIGDLPGRAVRIRVTMRDRVDLEQIATLAEGIARRAHANVVDGVVEIVWDVSGISDEGGPTRPQTNRRALVAFQRTVDELLREWHEREPVSKVELETL